jgi:hypothetical protein
MGYTSSESKHPIVATWHQMPQQDSGHPLESAATAQGGEERQEVAGILFIRDWREQQHR